jgi:hypothetical protein
MITQPGKEITWGEVHVGARQVFEDAGFEEVSRPPSGGWSCGSISYTRARHVDGRTDVHGGAVPRRSVESAGLVKRPRAGYQSLVHLDNAES